LGANAPPRSPMGASQTRPDRPQTILNYKDLRRVMQ
jgi:hypothetical protein